jgi:Fungal Zn(2)-Cys(6) binuclear cluster domain
MEVDQDDKRLRTSSYGPSPPIHQPRMQPSDAGSHNYPPPPGSGASYVGGSLGWAPPPSPFANELPQQANSYPPPPRENTYVSDVPYSSRPGSISAPTRSPGDGQGQALQHVNGANPEGPYQSQPGHPDYRARGGYVPPDVPPNGSHPTGLHIATSQEVMPGHQPFPQTPHGPYSHPQSAGPGPGPSPIYEPYYQHPHWSNPGLNRKKPVRAQQACDSCRTRKAKCDELRPCSHCKDNNLNCTYRDVPPHKQDRNAIALEAKFDTMQREVSDKLDQLSNDIRLLAEGLSPEQRARIGASSTSAQPQSSMFNQPSHILLADSQQSITAPAPAPPLTTVNNDAEAANALPHSHSTAAQNLLLWPYIMKLGVQSNPDYVMELEEQRGILRLYGRGEGHDKMDGSQGPASPADSSSSSRAEDSPSPPAESLWGYGFRPPYLSNYALLADNPGGLNPDGTLNFASDVVDKYYESYMKHMYILHPFLDKKTIKDHIIQFKNKYSRDRPAINRKRKLEGENSPTLTHELHAASIRNHSNEVERSVRNAIVLLVLAIGKICDHKAPLPASPPASSTTTIPTSAPTPRSSNSDAFSPTPGSPYPPLAARGNTSSSTVSERIEPERRNFDVIPGLAYYTLAAEILGTLRGGYDLSHVQAALLAGLYMGQLAHVIPSHDWITQAGKICQKLIDP